MIRDSTGQGRIEKIRAPPQPEIPGPPLRARLLHALTARTYRSFTYMVDMMQLS